MKSSISKQPRLLKTKEFRVNFYLLVLIIVGFSSFSAGQKTIQVRGKIINSKGDNVAKAQIQLLPAECRDCSQDVIEVFMSNENGDFSGWLESKTKYYFFIEEEVPDTYWKAINSPADTIRYLSKYKGTPIFLRQIPENGIFNLGNLTSTIQHFKTEIDLRNFVGNGTLKNQITKIQTKDFKGRTVSNGRNIAEKYFSDSSKIRIVLPRGIWILDVFRGLNGDEKIGSVKIQIRSETNIKKSYF